MYLNRMPQSDPASATEDEAERSGRYQAKVDELLALAEHATDPGARNDLFNLCLGYKLLAARLNSFHPTPVEQLLGGAPPPPSDPDPDIP